MAPTPAASRVPNREIRPRRIFSFGYDKAIASRHANTKKAVIVAL
jgi:hypothetical protein